MIFVLSGLNVQVLRYCIICLVLKSPNPGWWCVGLGVIGRANFVPMTSNHCGTFCLLSCASLRKYCILPHVTFPEHLHCFVFS